MFLKNSRYRKLENTVATDAAGRTLALKELRLLPDVTGKFLHTIVETDRLDNLSFKYYRQPKKWWRICDANPEVLSPQALLGKEPVVISRFALVIPDDGASPPWAELRRNLIERIGVVDIVFEENYFLTSHTEMYEGQTVIVNAEQCEHAVIVTYNRFDVTATEVANSISVTGIKVSQPVTIGMIGKNLVVPPDIVS
jgi:hypothetical protein